MWRRRQRTAREEFRMALDFPRQLLRPKYNQIGHCLIRELRI